MPPSSRDEKRSASVTQEEFRKNSKQVVSRAVRDGRIEITNAQGRVIAAVTAPREDRPVTFE